ncbi:MAG: hypothetical protein LBC40_06250 [Dysgonamonadaceae bacterium]|jgi:hypothetical protein|nr:hypothetical protein [Dysgonamonadaceae bacterium]
MKLIKLLLAIVLGLGSWPVHAAGTVRIVTNTNDDGAGSLRAQITASAGTGTASSPVDTIRFAPSLKGDTIVLASLITANLKNLVIDGEDNEIVISGNNQVRLLLISNAYVFEISNLTLVKAGGTSSGAITYGNQRSGGVYTLRKVRFTGNTANSATSAMGGAVYSFSSIYLIVDQCTFTGNTAYSEKPNTPNINGGGAIYSFGTVDISNSVFEDNSSNTGNGAVAALNLTVRGSVFKNNSAKGYGGAIGTYGASNNAPTVKLLGNTFIGNHTEGGTAGAVTGGGALGISHAAGNAILAANIFQDNTCGTDAAYNDFHHPNAGFSVTSGGYNVFKGDAVPDGADTWTKSVSDIASERDPVDAGTALISSSSPAYRFVASPAPIEGLDFPETDIFGNPYKLPYNAGADQMKEVEDPQEIVVDQPAVYPNGQEKHIGTSLVGTAPLSFSGIGFNLPEGLAFTENSYALKDSTVFTLSDITISEGDKGADTRLQLTVNFTPVAEQDYTDTLTISAAGAYDFVIPLRGVGISWTISPEELPGFGSLLKGDVSEAQTITISSSPISGVFSYALKQAQTTLFPVTEAEGYSDTGGGRLEIRFVPDAFETVYRDTLVVGSQGSARILEVPLEGSTLVQPVVSADSTLYRFGEVLQGETATGGKIKITLTYPQSHLTADGVFTFARAAEYPAGNNPYQVARRTLEGGTSQARTVEVTLSFTPPGGGEFPDTLVIRADYAEEYRIPLSGTGINPTGIDVPGVETGRAPSLQVRNGDIGVGPAAVGSLIRLYNLQGQAGKTQAVTSDAEILTTTSLPRGLYIVEVNNLKRKVIL